MTLPSREETIQRLATELNELCGGFCDCPCELDGPAESPDSMFREKHQPNCSRIRFIEKLYDVALSQSAAKIAKNETEREQFSQMAHRLRQLETEQRLRAEKAESESQSLREALRQLSADVRAVLGIAELEITQYVGTTNVECIKLRLDRAASLVSKKS
jgi:hypothetical protein